MILSAVILVAIWLEHLLLVGPALSHGSRGLPLGLWDGLITLGFFGLMIFAVVYFLDEFPELKRFQPAAEKR
jgi:hypothetical protein